MSMGAPSLRVGRCEYGPGGLHDRSPARDARQRTCGGRHLVCTAGCLAEVGKAGSGWIGLKPVRWTARRRIAWPWTAARLGVQEGLKSAMTALTHEIPWSPASRTDYDAQDNTPTRRPPAHGRRANAPGLEIRSAPRGLPSLRQSELTQAKLRHLFGVRPTRQGLLFVQPARGEKFMVVAGDFNNWSTTSHPMRHDRRNHLWYLLLPIDPGKWTYRIVADGHWREDTHNHAVAANPFGQFNNVAVMPTPEQISNQERDWSSSAA